MPTVIMLASFVVFRQIYLAVTKATGAGFTAVALVYPVGWILCSTLLLIRYSRSDLVRKSRIEKAEAADKRILFSAKIWYILISNNDRLFQHRTIRRTPR